jgi:hypothetical protein
VEAGNQEGMVEPARDMEKPCRHAAVSEALAVPAAVGSVRNAVEPLNPLGPGARVPNDSP